MNTKAFLLALLALLPLAAAAQTESTHRIEVHYVHDSVDSASDTAEFNLDDYDLSDILNMDADEIDNLVQKIVKKINKSQWHTNLDIQWGFHNWGDSPVTGIGGTDGDAAVRTSLNHVALALNHPVLRSRRVVLFAGLGLEWDKYKFHRGDIHFDHNHLQNGTATASESRLLTRYVILPIEVIFDLGRHWKLGLAAIGGLHWSGSHTGLRRETSVGDAESLVKDYSVNPYINPIKLDARVAVWYRGVGLYFQTATLPAFKSGCDELYPVKFGIIL